MTTRADVKVGFACNNRCLFCAQGERRRDTGFIPKAQLLEHLERGFAPGRGLVLTGGEPTIRKDLVEIVEAARVLGYQPIQVQTNGRMLAYAGLVRRLVLAGVREFSPALHGATPMTHDSLTRADGAYDETVRGIRNALASGAVVVTNTVVVQQNLHELTALIELLARLGVRHAQLALVHPVGTAGESAGLVPVIGEAAAAMSQAVRRGRALRMTVVVEAMPLCLFRGLEDAIVESAIPETTVVDLDGAAFAFSDWRRDQGKQKGPPCERCARSHECEGPWREYPERFGWDGYLPYGVPPVG